jgi:hypothetical protein
MIHEHAPKNAGEPKDSRADNVASTQKKARGKPFPRNNPGRKPGSKNRFGKDIRAALSQDLPAILAVLSEKARGGHVQAAIALMRNAIPQARERGELISFPAMPVLRDPKDALIAVAEIAAAVAEGRLTGDDAGTLLKVIDAFRSTHVAVCQEQRLVAIEKRIEQGFKQ